MILRKMALDMGVPISHIEAIAQSASHRYKVYRIPKRTGGTREIAHPAKELKSLQSWLATYVFSKLPVHDSVFSYRTGRSIKDHAELHRKKNYLVRIDIKDFFPSIKTRDVMRLIRDNKRCFPDSFTTDDWRQIFRIVCRYGCLTIGAPSSPVISNAVLYSFDKQWHKICKDREIIYSRYADDIYLSTDTPNILSHTLLEICRDIETREWPKLKVNQKKIVFTSRKHNRNVTGLTLTSDRKISIGHDKKRWLRSQVFKFSQGLLPTLEISHLRGYLSYVKSVEPIVITKLRKKYGAAVIRDISNAELTIRKPIKKKKKKK